MRASGVSGQRRGLSDLPPVVGWAVDAAAALGRVLPPLQAHLLGALDLHDDAVLDDRGHRAEAQPAQRGLMRRRIVLLSASVGIRRR